MPLHLIIDGYNLLAQITRSRGVAKQDFALAREALLCDVAAYCARRPHAVTVVFDGWHLGGGTERREHRLGLEVIFSRRGEKADQVIQRLTAEFQSDCAIVSSDREIIDFAKARGAFVMQSQEFVKKLHEGPLSLNVSIHKELDRGEDFQPKRGALKRGNPHKLPKALRQRRRQLKQF